MAVRGLRNSLLSLVPNWLSNRPGLNTGFKWLYVMALMGDCMLEAALEGVRASWPGKGTPDALPYIAQGRGLVQGETESNTAFEARLIAWRTTWQNAGSDEILALMIQSYLGNDPTVTIVNRAGVWVTAAPGGMTSMTTAAWNWDGTSGTDTYSAAQVAGWWSDIWIIVYPCEWAIEPTTSGTLDAAHGIDHMVTPSPTVDAILGLVRTWKGAHTFVRAIIWTYSATAFTPANPTADGNYGNWYKMVNGVAVQSRNTSARYWEPGGGG